MNRFYVMGVAAGLALAASPMAQACATCFGASDSKMAQGMNMGILVLLGFVGLVIGGITAAFVGLSVRSSRLEAARGEAKPAGPGTKPEAVPSRSSGS